MSLAFPSALTAPTGHPLEPTCASDALGLPAWPSRVLGRSLAARSGPRGSVTRRSDLSGLGTSLIN